MSPEKIQFFLHLFNILIGTVNALFKFSFDQETDMVLEWYFDFSEKISL